MTLRVAFLGLCVSWFVALLVGHAIGVMSGDDTGPTHPPTP